MLTGGTIEATRTWVGTDLCGNTSTCRQKVTTVDTTPPVITCPAGMTLNCDVMVPSPNLGSVAVLDTCDSNPAVQFVGDVESGTNPRIVTRTYRATDANNNASECTQVFTFVDIASLPPVIVKQPKSRTNNVGTTTTFTVQVVSCQTPTYQWYFMSNPITGANDASLIISDLNLANAGNYSVDVGNAAGTVSSQTAELVVNRPPIALPDAVTAELDTPLVIPVGTLLVNDSDPDSDPISVVSVSSPSDQGGRILLQPGQVTYTPPPIFVGTDEFFYTIKDGRGGFSTTSVDVTVQSSTEPGSGEVQVFRTNNGGYLLRFKAATAGDYDVQRTTILDDPSPWQVIGTVTVGAGGVVDFIDSNPPSNMAFYRFHAL